MKIYLRITAVVVMSALIVCISGAVSAMNWPAEDAPLIKNFGSNDKGRPVLGMVFSGDADVLAAEKGEVIFSRSKDDTASRLPSPFGAWTAVDHGDGLISIYSRYADENQTLTQVEAQQKIASAGTSGWSAQRGFYFIIYDRRERRWINPAMIITPQREARPLQVPSVELLNAQGLPVQSRNLTQGRYTILVNAGTAAGGTQIAPQRIICLVNGAEAGSLNFEAVSARDGVLMVYRNGLVPARQIYSNSPYFEAAEVFLNRGQINLEIIVQDIAGNSRSVTNRLVVN
jgi:hypothetical protein